jgi:transcription elongation GreA/GreB family factor
MGDLSENFAYSVAKGKVMGMDARMFHIKEQLKRVKPLKIGGNAGGLIAIGSIVTVEVNGKRKTLTLVGTQQADPMAGKISYHSPVGAALSNHLAGDTVTVETNGRKIEYKVMEVR